MAGLIRSLEVEGNNRRYLPFPVLSSSTFVKGDFLTFDSNGRLQQALTAGSNFGSGVKIVGQAESNAIDDYGNVRPYISVCIAEPGTRFWLPIYNATPASAVFTPVDCGVSYEMTYTSGGVWAVDNGHTTNVVCRYETVAMQDYPGWPTYNGVGTVQYPLVLVEFIGASCLLTGAR